MPQKLSPYKVSKMLALYFEGYSQSEIANKLKIHQSTISLHVAKFEYSSEQQGLEAAGEEFNVMNEVEALHSLAAELGKAKLTAEEAKIGVKMEQLFQQYGIKPEDHKYLIQACKQMNAEGFISSAVKLNQLESSTGMTYQQVIAQFASTYKQLEETKENLQIVTGKLNASKDKLADINKQKMAASQDLETHLNKIGVDMNRLTLVEDLALTLKKANISSEELGDYIQRQQLLNKAGISLDTFVAILEEAKTLTSLDQGKGLLQMLSKYGGLTEAVKVLQTKVQSLDKQVDGLEQKAKLKGEIEDDVVKLKAERTSLETCVAQLSTDKNTLAQIQMEVTSLMEKGAILKQEITNMEEYKALLSDDIEAKENKVSNLQELELKHDAVSANLSEIEAKEACEGTRWEMFESFIGFIKSSSFEEVEKFIEVMPHFLSEAKQGKYSPESLRNMMLRNLTGDTLQLLQCTPCHVRFVVDKPPLSYKGYDCPICGLSYQVKVEQEELEILKAALATPKPQILVAHLVTPEDKKPTPKDENSG